MHESDQPNPNISHSQAGLWLILQVASNALIGLLFQRLLAWRFGVSVEKSAFDIAFSIPFAVVSLSGLAAAHTVFVGFFARFKSRSRYERDAALSAILTLGAIIIALVVLASWLISGSLAHLLAPGLNGDDAELLRQLIVVLLPLSLPLGLGMLFSAASFASGLPISHELIMLSARAFVVLGAVMWPPLTASVTSIALWLLVAATLCSIAQIVILYRFAGLRLKFTLTLARADREWLIGRLAGFLSIAIFAQAAAMYYRSMATVVSVGFVAEIGFATSLVEPIATAFGRVLVFFNTRAFHPIGSALSASRNRVVFEVLTAGAVGLLAAVLVGIASPYLIYILYGGGQLQKPEVLAVSKIASMYAWILPGAAMSWTVLSHSVSQSKFKAPIVYVTGYVAQLMFLFVFGAGESGDNLIIGYLFPVWWQAIALTILFFLNKNLNYTN